MTYGDRTAPAEYRSRSALVRELASQLTRQSAPRLQLLIIVALAGATAFLASVVMLWRGGGTFESMALRYPVAALVGYISFVALIRLWIALHRPTHDSGFDIGDVGGDLVESAIDIRGCTPSRQVPVDAETELPLELESRARFSDAGRWRIGRPSPSSRDGTGASIDLDELAWLVVAGACAVGGVLAVAYVIYIAPVLLAEVALDAAVISALYRRLRRDETAHWLTTVVTRTWLPALVVVLFAMIGGYALEQVAPEAKSIGGIIRTIAD